MQTSPKSPGRVPRGRPRSSSRSRSGSRGRKIKSPKTSSRSNSKGRLPPSTPDSYRRKTYKSQSSPKIKETLAPLFKQGASVASSAGKQAKREINKLKHSLHSVMPKLGLDSPDSLINREQLQHELGELKQAGKYAYKSAKTNLIKYTNRKLEFGGPLGNAFLILFLPAFVIYMLHLCDKKYFSLWKIPHFRLRPIHYYDNWSLIVFCVWLAFQALLYNLPIGPIVRGLPQTNGKSLLYRCNGIYAYLISLLLFGVIVYSKYPVWKLCDHVIPLASISTLFTFIFSAYLFFTGRNNDPREPQKFIDSSDSNSTDLSLQNIHVKGKNIYRYFMGQTKNPRFGKMFDLKMFFEMRPGLIGWIILDLCYLAQKTHDHKFVSLPLLILTLLQGWYVLDAQWNEPIVLSTWDIRHENLGFMLLFGDLVWVPFLYSLQARYLAIHTVILPKWHLALCIILYIFGYTIFRMSNTEKALYTRSPNHPKFSNYKKIPTNIQGKSLLAGGWWGLVRHPNYLGDIIMALSMCLLSGFEHVLPYFYFIFLTALLIHREIRDEQACSQKYGQSWTQYRSIVRSRIIPFIY